MPSAQQKVNEEYFETQNLKGGVRDTEDGGAVIEFDRSKPTGGSKFYANLAEKLDENELNDIGRTLSELIERDKESRSKRDEQYEEGLKRTGLADDAPGGAQFMGASRVVHPMLTEACVDFAARSMKEIFPANGPAKAFIAGDPTDIDIDRGERLADFLNYQATVQIPEMRSELEQMCTQLPLGGGQYIKCGWHERKQRPTVLFVPIDDIFLPYAATNFYTAERKTHVQYLTALEYQQRVDSGMYRDIDVETAGIEPERSKSEEASDKIEGRELSSYNEDGLRTVYECFCLYEVEEKIGVAPYIVSIDKTTSRVLSVYRNWDEEDEKREELDWLVEFPFVPWRGAYPIGIVHMIGGIAAAATGSLRALLDSALINNFPGLLKLKGGTAGGQTERIDPTQVMEVEGAIADDDVRKLVMPMPYSPPSPVLFELLGFLVDAGTKLLRTSMEEMQDTSQDVPVGTTMARLEQGMMVYSAIHGRMHHSMGRLLKVLYRINKFYLEEEEVFEETGKLLVKRKDFDGPMTVVPVSDPNIFSESQRFAQIQLIAQRSQMLPQLYDLRKVEELILERMKIPNVDDLLLPKQEGEETNAVNENIAATMGRPVVAFPEQDHLAHMQVHLEFMTNPGLGMNPLIAPTCLPVLMGHLKEHIVLWYATRIFEVASEAAGMEINELQKKATTDERKAFDKMLAEASRIVSPQVQGQFQQLPQVVQQCQQFLQQLQPPPQDPAMQLGMAEIQSKEKIAGQQISVEQQKVAQQAQVEQLKAQHAKEIEMLKAQTKGQELSLKGQLEGTKLADTKEIEGAKLSMQSRQADQVLDMEAMKQQQENARTQAQLENNIIIEQMKQGHAREVEQLKAAHQAQLAEQTARHTKEQKGMDIESAHALEDKKGQKAQELEGMKQASSRNLERDKAGYSRDLESMKQRSAKDLEGMKQGHAAEMERFKQGGAIEQKKLDIASAHVMEGDKRTHEKEMQTRADTLDLYKTGGQVAHEKEMKAAEMAHAERLSTQEHDHESVEGEKDRKHTEKVEKKKAEHDMDKTKVVEKGKAKVAKDQLQLKEKEGKEQLKIKKEESKHGMGLKEAEAKQKMKFGEAEGKMNLQFKEKENRLNLSTKEQEAKNKLQFSKKLGETKLKLSEQQLKDKAAAAKKEASKSKDSKKKGDK